MNWDQVEGKWNQVKGSVREKWGELNDDEIAQMRGNREQLSGAIQERYGKTKEQAEEEIDEFIESL